MRQWCTWIIAGSLLFSGSGWAAQAQRSGAATPASAEQVPVLSGGVGENARNELAAKARDYNLKLVFALVSREYLSDVDVQIERGGRSVVSQRSDGPWMFVKLPPGDYTVRATLDGNAMTKKVSVGKQGQKVVNFLWPTSVGTTGTSGSAAR